MADKTFNPLELDAIGEIMNISLGSSATAVSNMLDHRVDITTPAVSVVPVDEFSLGDINPAIAVVIKYVSGLEGSNLLMLKRKDIKVIVDILLGTETADDEFEINELTVSAVCEVMNQMMGAAATALSDFLGKMINISPPEAIELNDFEDFKKTHFHDNPLVVVHFSLCIENALQSEFMNVMTYQFAQELISNFGLEEGSMSNILEEPAAPKTESDGTRSQEEIGRQMGSMNSAPAPAAPPAQQSADSRGGSLSQEEIERLMGSMNSAPAPAAPPAQQSANKSGGSLSQEEIERLMGSMNSAPAPAPTPTAPAAVPQPQMAYPPNAGSYPYPYPPAAYYAPPDQKVVQTQPASMPQFDPADKLGQEQAQNLELIMSVPLEVSVEIGRTRRKVKEILEFTKGSLVVLDKLAGDQVDIFVNGKCIAKGDVVVIDDNFGIRITEILQNPDLSLVT